MRKKMRKEFKIFQVLYLHIYQNKITKTRDTKDLEMLRPDEETNSWNECDGYILKSNPHKSQNLENIDVDILEAEIPHSFQFFNSDDDKTW
ncbi:hypothetical protein CHS0354_000992 [Potamilus streckersoni]|uniref:Uncharacterized protein n=1 Tax=Potamilus streckersoni TaxID=2493646 RepID=A0AAE0SAG4_9BIVA|nr:hypothetical protein CHS0354_000992 [Potamilus streckersoni]